MGINVDRYLPRDLHVGSLLAALAGAFTAPTVSVVPGLGVEVIVLSFAVVVIGGLGSLPGAALGAVIVGMVRSLSVHYLPQVELFVIYFVMAAVLALRPRGPVQPAPSRERYEAGSRRCRSWPRSSSLVAARAGRGCRNGRCSS